MTLPKRSGIDDLRAAPPAPEPATLAVVSLDASAQASYDFYLNGTADWQWTAQETGRAPDTTAVLHFGSIASWTPPGDARIRALADQMRGRGDVLISYDPNIRPRISFAIAPPHLALSTSPAWLPCGKAGTATSCWLSPPRTTWPKPSAFTARSACPAPADLESFRPSVLDPSHRG
jgi:hypothetical protein